MRSARLLFLPLLLVPLILCAETEPTVGGPGRVIRSRALPSNFQIRSNNVNLDLPDQNRILVGGALLDRTDLTLIHSGADVVGAGGECFGTWEDNKGFVSIRNLADGAEITTCHPYKSRTSNKGTALVSDNRCAAIWDFGLSSVLHIFSLPDGTLLKTIPVADTELALTIHDGKLLISKYPEFRNRRADLVEIDLATYRQRTLTGPSDTDYQLVHLGNRFTVFAKSGAFLIGDRLTDSSYGPFPTDDQLTPTSFLEIDGQLFLGSDSFSPDHPESGFQPLDLADITASFRARIKGKSSLSLLETTATHYRLHELSIDLLPTLHIEDASGRESDDVLTFTVTINRPSPDPIEIRYKLDGIDAEEGNDFVADAGTITISPGETSKTLDVGLVEDLKIEDHESFQLRLVSWDGAFYDGRLPGPRGTILGSGIRYVGKRPLDLRTIDVLVNDDFVFVRGEEGLHSMSLETGDTILAVEEPSLSSRFYLSGQLVARRSGNLITVYDASTLAVRSNHSMPDGAQLAAFGSSAFAYKPNSFTLQFQALDEHRPSFNFSLATQPPLGWHDIHGVKIEGDLALVKSTGTENRYLDTTFQQLHLIDLTNGETRWTREIEPVEGVISLDAFGLFQGTPFFLTLGGMTLLDPNDGGINGHVSEEELGQPIDHVVNQSGSTLFLNGSSTLGVTQLNPLDIAVKLPSDSINVVPARHAEVWALSHNGRSYDVYQDFNGIPSAHIEHGTFSESEGIAEIVVRMSEASPVATRVRLEIEATEPPVVNAITDEAFPVPAGETRLGIPVRVFDDFIAERPQEISTELQVDGGPALPDRLLILDNEALRSHLSFKSSTPAPAGAGALFGTSLAVSGERTLIGWTYDASSYLSASPGMDWPLIDSSDETPGPTWLPRATTGLNTPHLYGLGISLTSKRALTAIAMAGSRTESGLLVHDFGTPASPPQLIRRPLLAPENFGQTLLEIPGIVVAGSPGDEGGQVYFLDATSFQTLGILKQSGASFGSFGSALAFDGSTLWIGSPARSVVEGFDPYTRELTASIPSPGAPEFGRSLAAIDGELLVGAEGHAYLYRSDELELSSQYAPPNPSKGFGSSVALSPTHILIGDPLSSRESQFGGTLEETATTGESSGSSIVIIPLPSWNGYGSAYLWKRSGGRVTKLLPTEHANAIWFGTAVALTPDRALITNISSSIDAPVLETFTLTEISPSTDGSVEVPVPESFLQHFQILISENQVGIPHIEITLPSQSESFDQHAEIPWGLQHSTDLRSWHDVLIGAGPRKWLVDPVFALSTEGQTITIHPNSDPSGYFRIRAD